MDLSCLGYWLTWLIEHGQGVGNFMIEVLWKTSGFPQPWIIIALSFPKNSRISQFKFFF
jgi:hypothetical protein